MRGERKEERMKKEIKSLAEGFKDITGVKQISVSKIVVKDWTKLKCQFGCDSYGKNWACPPLGEGPEVLRKSIKDYKYALLVEGRTSTVAGQKKFMKAVLGFEKKLFLANYYKAFALMPGPCGICKTCTRPKPCRYPHMLRPEMAGMGVDVFATLKKLNVSMKVLDKPQEFKTYAIILLE